MKTIASLLCLFALIPPSAIARTQQDLEGLLVPSNVATSHTAFAHPEAFSSLYTVPSATDYASMNWEDAARMSAPPIASMSPTQYAGVTRTGFADGLGSDGMESAIPSSPIFITSATDYEDSLVGSEPRDMAMLLTGLCLLLFMTYRRLR